MNKRLLATALMSSAVATFASDSATPSPAPPLGSGSDPFRPERTQSRNRFGLQSQIGFNINGRFKNSAGYLAPNTPGPGPALAGLDHFYDDGFNRVDAFGNAPIGGVGPGVTSFWSYQNPSQATEVPGSIVMHSTTFPSGDPGEVRNEDPRYGLELTYARILGQSQRVSWGLEAAFGFLDIAFDDSSTGSASVQRITDAYDLGGAAAPGLPFTGLYNPGGPATLLGDTPARTVTTFAAGTPGAATVQSDRQFDADVYEFRLGPMINVNVTDRLVASLSGGLALAFINSELSYRDRVTVPGSGSLTYSGSDSHSDWLVGGYVGGQLSYELTPAVDVTAAVQYRALGLYEQSIGNRMAEADLRNALMVMFGLGFKF